jgi:hypothetical protein
MAKRETAKIANSEILNGDKLYLERAKKTLPYLVRQAKAGKPIYYSDLAEQIEIPNARNLNYVLGAIGRALIELGKKEKIEIPPIQCIVVNKKQDLPGEGIGWFISEKDFTKLNKTQKQKIVEVQLAKIYTFQYWDWVLEEFNLQPIEVDIEKEIKKAKSKRGTGESEDHKNFKDFISKNPSIIGLKSDLKSEIEYCLPSADKIDVLFRDKLQKIGVEVKSIISDEADILRGIFQCVKYKHLIEAEQVIYDEIPDSKVILALQGKLPEKLILIKNLLGIEVIEDIKTSR